MERSEHWEKFEFPFIAAIINKCFGSAYNFNATAEQMIASARKTAGLQDFGTDFFMPALEKFCNELSQFKDFHGFGGFLYKNKIRQHLVNRLWAHYWFTQKNNEINVELPQIVLVTGLQRSGTTFLQRLLGSLPDFEGIQSKDIIFPVPTNKSGKYPSLFIPKYALTILDLINPTLKTIHSITPEDLEEEVVLMDHSFMTTLQEILFNDSGYGKWVEQQDQLPIYQDLKMWLQLIRWKKKSRKPIMLLKSPHHMQYLDTFLSVFPTAKILQLHRKPTVVVPSFCSMVYHGKKTFLKGTDSNWIGEHWLRKDGLFVDNCMEVRATNQESFHDVSYTDLKENTLDTLQDILKFCGVKWTEGIELKVKEHLVNHKQHRYGKHIYTKEQFGLTDEKINAQFAKYNEKYKDYL